MEASTQPDKDAVTAQALRARRGSAPARAWIADRAYTTGLRLATFSLGDPDLAQDVGQEVAIRVLRGLPKLRDVDRFDAWTYRICVREVKRAAKKRQRQERRLSEEAKAELRVEATFTQRHAERDWLISALGRLSERQRLVLGLRYVYGLSDKEIATAIEARRGTVRSLLSRGLTRLREEAEAEEETEPGREAAAGRNNEEALR